MSSARVLLKVLFIKLLLLGLTGSGAIAQNAFDALRYSLEYPGGGAANMAMPGAGVTLPVDLGSSLDNPASMGLMESNATFFGLSFRNVTESVDYLDPNQKGNENQTGLSNLGFVYEVPTSRGSLVFGAGYNQTVDFNRVVDASGYNNSSSITFMFNESGFYGDAAYNAFAIDSIGDRTQSVFRFGQFRGIRQRVNMVESGQKGEISAFMATEFQKDFFIGLTLGIPIGSYSYERTFFEEDSRNLYTGGPDGTYDVQDMLNVDKINGNIAGLKARFGLLYRLLEYVNIGASYQFPTRLNIEESYSTSIETSFDNGDLFDDRFNGEVSYKVRTPRRASAGIGLNDLKGISAALSAEWVDYSNIEMQDLGERIELNENEFITNNYTSVYNLKASLAFQVSEYIRPFMGYAFYPSPRKNFDTARRFISGGVNLGREEMLNVNIGIQYARWSDELVLYNSNTPPRTEVANEDINRLQIMAGLSYRF